MDDNGVRTRVTIRSYQTAVFKFPYSPKKNRN